MMAELGAVTAAVLAIARQDLRDGLDLAEQVCRACVVGVGVDGAAISLFTAGNSRETLWASDATAELLEDLQFSLGEGACVQAAVTGRAVVIADLHHSSEADRWPIFAAAVKEQSDVVALYAVPLRWGTVNVGVLDLYRTESGTLSVTQLQDVIAAMATTAWMLLPLYISLSHPDGGDLDWLERSPGERREIHRAAGMVMFSLECGSAEALTRMRAYAFAERRMLGDVAHDMVARRIPVTRDTM